MDCAEDGHNNFLVPVEGVIVLDVYFLEGGWMVSEEDGGEGATELEEFVVCFGFILVEGGHIFGFIELVVVVVDGDWFMEEVG